MQISPYLKYPSVLDELLPQCSISLISRVICGFLAPGLCVLERRARHRWSTFWQRDIAAGPFSPGMTVPQLCLYERVPLSCISHIRLNSAGSAEEPQKAKQGGATWLRRSSKPHHREEKKKALRSKHQSHRRLYSGPGTCATKMHCTVSPLCRLAPLCSGLQDTRVFWHQLKPFCKVGTPLPEDESNVSDALVKQLPPAPVINAFLAVVIPDCNLWTCSFHFWDEQR